jgi:hypothetical protein
MFIKIKRLFLSCWWRMKMTEKLPGTDIDVAEEILSAYVLMKSGDPVYIVISTNNGSKIYPYTSALENALKSKIGTLKDYVIDIHEAIKFYFENQSVIAFIDKMQGFKSKFKPGSTS